MAWGTDLTHEDVTAIVNKNNELVRQIHELTEQLHLCKCRLDIEQCGTLPA